jgi:hypothetical protein
VIEVIAGNGGAGGFKIGAMGAPGADGTDGYDLTTDAAPAAYFRGLGWQLIRGL